MASPVRAATAAVIDSLGTQAADFNFFQAVRLLRQWSDRARSVGEFRQPGEELVRFSIDPSLSFPGSAVVVVQLEQCKPHGMTVRFLGLVGGAGVLPLRYTDYIVKRQEGYKAFLAFLDLFHHRTLSLYYRAGDKWRPPVPGTGGRDRTKELLLSIMGANNSPALADRPSASLFRYAIWLSRRPRSAAALQFILSDFLRLPVEVQQFAGRWYAIDAESQIRLGTRNSVPGNSIGDEIWDVQAGVRIRLGPLTRSQYRNFLPGSGGYCDVRVITRLFDVSILFHLQLVLKQSDVPKLALGDASPAEPGLGWDTWIHRGNPDRDAEDSIVPVI